MNRFSRFLREFFAMPFKGLRDQLRDEQAEEPEDGVYDASEWLGFLGASVWLVLSLGRIKWENDDWRAKVTGGLLLAAGVVLMARRVALV